MKKLPIALLTFIIIISLNANMLGWTDISLTSQTGRTVYLYPEGGLFVPFLLAKEAEIGIYYTVHTGFYHVEEMSLSACTKFVHNTPVNVASGISNIKLFRNSTLVSTATNFAYPDVLLPIEYLNHSYKYGISSLQSYLLRNNSFTYKFEGLIEYIVIVFRSILH